MSSLINLQKTSKVSLEKNGVNLSKDYYDVVVALDISSSMRTMYGNGLIQELTERLLALGLNLDRNKQIDMFLFGQKSHHVGEVTESNYKDYVKNNIISSYPLENSTYYAKVMKDISLMYLGDNTSNEDVSDDFEEVTVEPPKKKGIISRLFGRKSNAYTLENNETAHSSSKITDFNSITVENASKTPTLVFFITDGDNFDQRETEKLISELSKYGIFWQFVGIGNSSFEFLENLDEMQGRFMDNANFFPVNDLRKISDSELFDRISVEFPQWLIEAKTKGIIQQ